MNNTKTYPEAQLFELSTSQTVGQLNKQNILIGGFSGLHFISRDVETDSLDFYTLTDRGPNAEEIKTDNGTLRPFLNPGFQPLILKIRAHKPSGKLQVVEELPLFIKPQIPFSGRPNISLQIAKEKKFQDEIPIDLNKKHLEYDLMGIDPESIAIDQQKRFWIGEEYRPSILVLDAKGLLIKRLIPKNSFDPKLFTEKYKLEAEQVQAVLPEAYKYRKLNRGFEALGFNNNKIFTMPQSPLEIPGRVNPNIIRILVIDSSTFKPIAEYLYEVDAKKADKIGDLVMLNEKEFLVIEQNGKLNSDGIFHVYKVDMSQASNVLNQAIAPELMPIKDFKKSVRTVKKTLIIDMAKQGYNFAEKIEGLTVTDKKEIVIVNDNDFSLENNKLNPNKKTVLGVFPGLLD